MRPISYALLASVLLLIGGCGGSGTSVQSGSTAKLAFAIEWPAPSRFIHQSATHIVVSAKVNNIPIVLEGIPNEDDGDPHTLKIVRPDPSLSITSSQVSMTGLPSGPITFTVESFRTGETKALGKAVVPVVLVPGDNPNLEFVLESQTATVEVSLEPAGSIRRVGQVLNLSAKSKQETATVISGSGEFTYTLSDPSKLRLVGDSQVEVLAEGTSTITARERGNDGTGKTGTATVRIDEYEDSSWSLMDTGLAVSQSGNPVFSSTPAYKDGVAYFGYGRNLLSVGSSGSWTQTPVTGLEPDVVRIELIGVGPSEELYVRGFVQTGAFTYTVRDIYRISSGFTATRIATGSAVAHVFSVNRLGRFSARIPSFDNWDVSLHSGPITNLQPWVFTGQHRKPVFLALDSGGAVVWNYDGGAGIVNSSSYIATLTPGTSNTAQEITRAGYSHVEIATMNQEGYWCGVAKSGSLARTVVGKDGQVIFEDDGEGANVFTAFPNQNGVTAFPVTVNGVPDHWEVYNPVTNQSLPLDLGSLDLTALGIHSVVNGGVMVASYQGKVAILRRSN